MSQPGFSEDLVAPCGMDCNVCRAFLAFSRNMPRMRGQPHCSGCRPRQKKCAFIKGHCTLLGSDKIRFCYECADFPCRRLQTLDRRYVTSYRTSLVANLRTIKAKGVREFLAEEERRWRCPSCGGTVSIHTGQCCDCHSG